MKYDELYKTFKEEIPEGYSFFEIKEKENLIDERQDVLGQCKQYMKKIRWNIVKKWKNIF